VFRRRRRRRNTLVALVCIRLIHVGDAAAAPSVAFHRPDYSSDRREGPFPPGDNAGLAVSRHRIHEAIAGGPEMEVNARGEGL